MFKKLNLPEYDIKLKTVDGKLMIFDVLRKKYLKLTEEEWVRQNFVHFLITEKRISKSMIKVESGTTYNRRLKRTDILIYSNSGNAAMVIECKAPDIPINEKVLFQASIYGKTLKVAYLGVTNGLKHYFWEIDHKLNSISQLNAFPDIK